MDLSTTYMGMGLKSPLIASASPLTGHLDTIKRLADAGASAIVLNSLFEEQIEHDADELNHYLHYGADRFAESLTYFPNEPDYKLGPVEYLKLIEQAKAAVDVPVIASLNGTSERGWTSIAVQMAQAGADAIECNVYYIPTNPQMTGESVEKLYLAILRAVKSNVQVPVAMKLSPFFSATANMLTQLDENGADGLVLFNRFYQPDLDVDALEVVPSLALSTSAEIRLPMRWIAIMHGQVQASLAASSGVHTGLDAAKMILAGADAVMMTSAILKNGINHFRTVQEQLTRIMEEKQYESIEEMRGVLSQKSCPDRTAFERANYMKVLNSYGRTATLE